MKNTENFLFTHGKDKADRRFTIAAKVEDTRATFGVSVCSNQDNFCRKIGRNIAKQRAVGRPATELIIAENLDEKKKREMVFAEMFQLKDSLTEDATQAWIRNK